MSLRIARSLSQVLVSLAIAVPLGTGLVWGRSGLARVGDASLDFVGHLIDGVHNASLDPFDPTYPRFY